jgi:hypothetical protein
MTCSAVCAVNGLQWCRGVSPYDGSARDVRDHGVTTSCSTSAVRSRRPGWLELQSWACCRASSAWRRPCTSEPTVHSHGRWARTPDESVHGPSAAAPFAGCRGRSRRGTSSVRAMRLSELRRMADVPSQRSPSAVSMSRPRGNGESSCYRTHVRYCCVPMSFEGGNDECQ